MNGLRLRIGRLAVALSAVALIWACNAPFIPVPPPSASFTSELVSDGAGGMKTVWTTHGPASPATVHARFSIFDFARKAGVIVEAGDDGSFVSPAMDGTVNDHVQVQFETPMGELSPPACLLLVDGVVPAPTADTCP